MVKVIDIKKASFDESYLWISYIQDEHYGYELRCISNLLEPLNLNKIPIENIKSEGILRDVIDSENDMVYIDEGLEDNYKKIKENIQKDIELYPNLNQYIEFTREFGDFETIILYGGIITEFLF